MSGGRFATLLLGCVPALLHGAPQPEPMDWFGPWHGCALVVTRDRHRESRVEFGAQQCGVPLSPCSTFKIPNALIGLHEGAVSGPEHVKRWDGIIHAREVNNRDHDLASAIEHSVVWYFQSLARDIGADRMQSWLSALEYGNQNISSGIDRFWISGSLEISAYQQLAFLKRLDHGVLPFRPRVQQQLRDMLRQPSDLPGKLHGKTGSCRGRGEQPDHGWVIGWVDWHHGTDSNPETTWFVVNIRGDEAWGWKARSIALNILNELHAKD